MGVVLLVRHGQASFGADDYDVLSETGWAQGRLLGKWLAERDVVPTAVIHGGMRRQRDTGAAMAEAAGWSVATDTKPDNNSSRSAPMTTARCSNTDRVVANDHATSPTGNSGRASTCSRTRPA